MAENVFYLNLAAGCFLVYGIVVPVLRNRRERRQREKLRAACAEIKRLKNSIGAEQHEPIEAPGYDFSWKFGQYTLDDIEQLQDKINQGVIELEREL